ncbi:MAG: DUF4278 domain-containing protein [Leptolyngbyaceae cyanobacterium SM1_1_3]|nr:DUF4278 domain-containing protein [Leptolyngbyaceae cyanobacterium SM1_1_3]NJN02475.1 DUF4278 domain-containing protein [Leptolyngbyaceae cyanobacterium RM1_1_2]NJO10178.1 DUF4278 domain-containing protein [Leptolyngbyaceae cyanobacterium SL_1_1]
MKLCYRGVEYDYNPPALEVTESDILCQYRGRPLRYSYVRHVPIPQPVATLSYRGVAYQTGSKGQIELAATPTESIFAKLGVLSRRANPMAEARRELFREATLVHQENIRRNVLHRLEVARAKGNEVLVRQLEDEMQQIA